MLPSEAAAATGCKSSSIRFPARKGCSRPVEQEVLQREWESLGAKEKAKRRAQRARRGERCTECGCVGYFRRNCPTCPPVRFDVRKDTWRLLTEQEIEERSENTRGRQPCGKADRGVSSIPVGKASRMKTETATTKESDRQNSRDEIGQGFLWGPLAEVAVNAAVPAAAMEAKSYGDFSSERGVGTTTIAQGQREGHAASHRQSHSGTSFEVESMASAALGAEMAKAGVTVIIPSLSGSSDLSSGVISGFRKALVRADGGGATMEACPSIVSSLNDIPGSYDESGLARQDLYNADSARRHSYRRNRTVVGEVADGNVDSATGVNGIGTGDNDQREQAMWRAEPGDDERLVRQKLTWRWPEFSSPVEDDTQTSSPQAFLPSRANGNGHGGDVHGSSVGDGGGVPHDANVADDASQTVRVTSSSATESCRTSGETHDPGRTPGTAPLSRVSPQPLVRNSGNAEVTVSSPPRKAPRGSYLRQRGAMVLTIQENLHLALTRLAEAVREQAHSVSSSVSSAGEMMRGPRGGEPPEQYYDASTRKDFRDFFDDEEEESARRQQPKAYAYLGGLREVGTAKYVFDRTSHSHAEKGALAAHLRGDYEPRANGYRGKNVHSVTDWRRPNTSLDRYAVSGRNAMALVAESDRTLKSQGVWVRQQIRAREQRRQRANHMLEVYRSELRQEQLREIEVLRLPAGEQRLRASKTMQDQIAAADRIMRTIARYGHAGNMEDAHYIAYAADAAQRAGLTEDAEKERTTVGCCGAGHHRKEKASAKEVGGRSRGGPRRQRQQAEDNDIVGGDVPPGRVIQDGVTQADSKAPNGRKTDGGARDESDEDSADDKMSPYSLAVNRPVPAAIQPKAKARGSMPTTTRTSRPTQNLAVTAARRDILQSERLRTFRLAGHPLRRGTEDDTTAVPALIPIPEGLGNATGEHKSYAAGRIVETLRKSQVDSITGRRNKLSVPLWHRATEDLDSGAGSVLYSDLIGHTYSVLVGPKRTTGAG